MRNLSENTHAIPIKPACCLQQLNAHLGFFGNFMREFAANGSIPVVASAPWSVLLFTAVFSFAFVNSQRATAQVAPTDATAGQPYTNQYQGAYVTRSQNEVFRVRHIEGDGQGGVPAYTNFGATKFAWTSGGVLMIDGGARITNESDAGFTAGVHHRIVAGNVILGTGAFYDFQHDFQQGSLAFELFTENWSFRSNGYLVLGDDVETESEFAATQATNIFFQGNHILADNLLLEQTHEVALSGVDFELARQIAFHASEAYLGGYYLEGDFGQNTFGTKGGVRGFLTPDLTANVNVCDDDLFGTSVYGGVTWFIGARVFNRPNMSRRLMAPVERNEQVAVVEVERVTPVLGPIVLTQDDDQIEVVHVAAGAAGANDGTFEDPFNALPSTQDSDIVYVHANGVFVGQSYTVAEDQRFLGEGAGNIHLVETDQLGNIVLPDGNGGANRPIIQAAPGNAIVMGGSDAEVSNFEIQNAVANGIFGDGIDGFDVNRNVITGSGGRGIFFNNVAPEADEAVAATGEISDNVVTNSAQQNIQVVLASDFEGEITGNTASTSTNSNGIDVSGPFIFDGEIENNTASGNFLNGIAINVAEFGGDIEGNTANTNGVNGLFLTFDVFRGDIEGNTTNGNTERGIDFNIVGNFFSRADIEANTANNNGLEGIHLLFAGTGTSGISVLGNNLSGNNGGVDREFFAENEDVFGNAPKTFIELDGNTSTNALGAGPPFNYEFDNNDAFADGEMTLDLGTNIGTVEIDNDVEFGEFPF